MKLRLAKYNLKTGKFERFLELGRDFYFGGVEIFVEIIFNEGNIVFPKNLIRNLFQKDEKDPLGRFNGLFDGRTYGNGGFVLIRGKTHEGKTIWEDDYISYPWSLSKVDFEESSCGCCKTIIGINKAAFDYKIYSNLHENPELWGEGKMKKFLK